VNAVLPALLALTLSGVAPFLPHPSDKSGVGLRIHSPSIRGPFLAGEVIDRVQLRVTLLNYSKHPVEHDPLVDAEDLRTVAAIMTGPDGKPYARIGGRFYRNPYTERVKTQSGKFESASFPFAAFGYFIVRDTGRYRIQSSMEVDKKTITSPPMSFEVVDVPEKAILLSQAIPLNGFQSKLPVNEQTRPFVEQVQIGKRTLLVYRRFNGPKHGGGIDFTFRLIELPDKAEMTVDGAYGDGKPLTIKYKDANSMSGWTKLVIDSDNGRPWTEEEERLRIKGAKTPPPAPRPIRP
jgi:hypothetical protein